MTPMISHRITFAKAISRPIGLAKVMSHRSNLVKVISHRITSALLLLLTLSQRRLAAMRRRTSLAALLLLGAAVGCSSAAWPTAPTTADELVHLDAAQGQLSEGLALHDGAAYLGFAASAQVVAIDLAGGKLTPYSSLPTPAAGAGFVTGLAFFGDDLYGALVSFVPDVQAGIYRAASAGAPATLFAKDPDMIFPNGLWFDTGGLLYVTDSAAGVIFRITTDGVVSKWASDPLLVGGKDYCGAGKGVGVSFDIGANGIVRKGDAFYVTNTDKASVIRIPIAADGSAGPATAFSGPSCADLSGADGITLAPDGDFVVASNHLSQLLRVDGKGVVTPILSGAPLDFPTSMVFQNDELYVSNFAFLDALNPGLLRIK